MWKAINSMFTVKVQILGKLKIEVPAYLHTDEPCEELGWYQRHGEKRKIKTKCLFSLTQNNPNLTFILTHQIHAFPCSATYGNLYQWCTIFFRGVRPNVTRVYMQTAYHELCLVLCLQKHLTPTAQVSDILNIATIALP
jgi:hypothetical protein